MLPLINVLFLHLH